MEEISYTQEGKIIKTSTVQKVEVLERVELVKVVNTITQELANVQARLDAAVSLLAKYDATYESLPVGLKPPPIEEK
jgi:hypothetical protein